MDNNHFNELLLHTLKQLGIRLDRVDDRLDRVDAKLDQKADKEDVKRLEEKLDVTNEVLKTQGERLDRIEGSIRTSQWVLGVEIALVGVIVTLLKGC